VGGLVESAQDSDEGRFSGPVFAQNRMNLTREKVNGDVPQDRLGSKDFAEALGLDGRFRIDQPAP
jgi:hypothetical protein